MKNLFLTEEQLKRLEEQEDRAKKEALLERIEKQDKTEKKEKFKDIFSMKAFGWLLFIALFIYVYFINRDIGVNFVTPLFNKVFPWIGGVFLVFLIGYVSREKLGEWLGRAKSKSIKSHEDIKKNVKHISIKWAWLIVVVIIAIFSFYWFSVRPGQIRKECYAHPYPSYGGCLINKGLKSE